EMSCDIGAAISPTASAAEDDFMHELTSLYFQRRGALSAGNRPTARNLKTTITRIGCVAPSCDRMTVARGPVADCCRTA
ncbi:MAG: hypothetical protein WAZ97_14840, partial [Pseudolabrys sp.]